MTGPFDIHELLQQASRHHQAGRAGEAEAGYRRLLALKPDHADALQMLGVLSHQTGRSEEGIELLRRAIRVNPVAAEYHVNLGAILASQKQWEQAIASFRQAIALRPDLAEAHHNLGRALRETGKLDEAIEALQAALRLRPDYADALHNLGDALLEKGLAGDAIDAFKRALSVRPNFPQTLNNLANAWRAVGELDKAVGEYRQAIVSGGESAEILNNLAIALHDKGSLDEAATAGRRAISLKGDFADAHLNLGNILRKMDRLDEAIGEYRRVLELRPDMADAEANLGAALRETGLADDALECYRRAMSLTDEAWPASAFVFTLYFHPDFGPKRIREEHTRWNDRYAKALAPADNRFDNDRSPDRRLRIGYVSPDFRGHSQSQFTVPLLSHHDHEQFEVFCYSNVAVTDSLTDRIKGYADAWREIAALKDGQVADLVRRDRIDILVDLTMHMDRNRLLLFARKPAPVQVTWLAYPGTTGLTAIDYRLSDPHLDPSEKGDIPNNRENRNVPFIPVDPPSKYGGLGADDQFYSETTIRLPDTFWCYDPLVSEPDVNVLPATRNGFVTFGCLNNFAKITDLTLDVWAKVLNRIAGSRLILLAPVGSARRRVVQKLRQRGIEESRVEFIGRQPRAKYLLTYHHIDLCLDTFPYNGHTTTLDSLWMGVPPLTMRGPTAVSRGGFSILSNLGLQDLVASDADTLVETATRLAGDLPSLGRLRADLRPRMEASPLMDGARFAHNVEAVYRQIWRNWCKAS